MSDSSTLTPRAVPKQERSRATHERILQESALLLDEVGADAFNTNLLAGRAALSPRAIYRYFPNKWAILQALAERARQHEREWVGDLSALSPQDDWHKALDRAIFDYYAAASKEVGYRALRAAAESSPILREQYEADNIAVQRELAIGLRALGVRGDDAEVTALCCVVIEASNRILDIALQSDEVTAHNLLRILHQMVSDTFSRYLD